MPGSQISKSRPDPTFSFSFLDLSWFERRKISKGSNRVVRNSPSPRGFFDHHLKQPALLGGGLLQEQLARTARQVQHVDGVIDWGQRGLLDILNLAQQTILLSTPGSRMLVEKLLGDAPVELVQVHGLDARFDLVASGLQFLDGLYASRLLGLV
jgi:hypothetical protein